MGNVVLFLAEHDHPDPGRLAFEWQLGVDDFHEALRNFRQLIGPNTPFDVLFAPSDSTAWEGLREFGTNYPKNWHFLGDYFVRLRPEVYNEMPRAPFLRQLPSDTPNSTNVFTEVLSRDGQWRRVFLLKQE